MLNQDLSSQLKSTVIKHNIQKETLFTDSFQGMFDVLSKLVDELK